MVHAFQVDYRKRDGRTHGTLVNRGFFIHGVPRPLVLCRLLGHKPVVDGTPGTHGPNGYAKPGHRWVCCDRCGVRPDPQGSLDPERWDIGDRYIGPYTGTLPELHPTPGTKTPTRRRQPLPDPGTPGPWPRRPVGEIGGQLIVGKSFPGWEIEFKVGNAGSEHTLAAHLRLHPVGALYLHTERFGTWLQRRFNPTGYDSRITGLAIRHGGIHWTLWAKRDEWSASDPWWMRGAIKLDPRDRLLGRRRYEYEDIGEPVTATVRMPHGDDHQVTLQLQRCTGGRNRRRFHSWTVHWSTRPGIPTKPHGGEVLGSSVTVSAQSVEERTWPAEAAAGIASQLTADRTRYGYGPRLPLVAEDEFDVEVD